MFWHLTTETSTWDLFSTYKYLTICYRKLMCRTKVQIRRKESCVRSEKMLHLVTHLTMRKNTCRIYWRSKVYFCQKVWAWCDHNIQSLVVQKLYWTLKVIRILNVTFFPRNLNCLHYYFCTLKFKLLSSDVLQVESLLYNSLRVCFYFPDAQNFSIKSTRLLLVLRKTNCSEKKTKSINCTDNICLCITLMHVVYESALTHRLFL
jgi:hypothetical protein